MRTLALVLLVLLFVAACSSVTFNACPTELHAWIDETLVSSDSWSGTCCAHVFVKCAI